MSLLVRVSELAWALGICAPLLGIPHLIADGCSGGGDEVGAVGVHPPLGVQLTGCGGGMVPC